VKRRRLQSTQNPILKGLIRLREKRTREREGRYLIEGMREVARAADAGVPLQQLFVGPEFLAVGAEALIERLERRGVEVVTLSKAAFEKASYRESPDGVLAVAAMQTRTLEELAVEDDALVLILDGLEKPGNVGALLRTADAVGASAVILLGGIDLHNPNLIRSSMGSFFHVPLYQVDEGELHGWLERQTLQLVAATPEAERCYWDADYRSATAILLGAEHAGLARVWRDEATVRVSIPMVGRADSLNVATAGALLLYEALRQRRA
jgi:TrmH family RNA methyltransferase